MPETEQIEVVADGEVRTYDGTTPFSKPEDDVELGADGMMPSGDVVAPDWTADQVEQDSAFKAIPPGNYKLKVLGFLPAKGMKNPVVLRYHEGWIGDRKVTYKTRDVTVKFGIVGDVSYQQLTGFQMPAGDPKNPDWDRHYLIATSKQGGGGNAKGWQARVFFQFLEKGMGIPFAVGQKLPREALDITQWVGREFYAEIENEAKVDTKTKQPMLDPTTRQPILKPKVKFFSYRLTEDKLAGLRRGGEIAAAARPHKAEPAELPYDPRADL